MSSPSRTTRPAVRGNSPIRCLSSVVLPAPFSPTIETAPRVGTSKLTSKSTRLCPYPPHRPLTRNSASGSGSVTGWSGACDPATGDSDTGEEDVLDDGIGFNLGRRAGSDDGSLG